ncbi:MAG: type I-B CRISPR-associated endonuclease Cas1 [Thermoanaerobacteraceae bacterium]|uniref:type I-B CRISPR-associated endonuclease Cas1b n=1 Tax=Thermanaeromonas sp. C210 TaxID=2731925 RepID=UPI00155BD4FB|nr:type I-B CRISPR-associated endonuclease Cas1b [Thermanaeromonas sp. C210]MBE3582160.1 type I-B CRISPR-associated endonuclease Cas1 [Thermoanaerobacteraceae bacterium]GFN23389.1 subtype I-B CRISPR-associated endonuclease Cas1 [Thermanaeromonas sp. C210]
MQKTLYLFASGRLRRKDNTICVDSEEGTKYFPVINLRDIFVFGEVDLNKKLLEFLEENEVILHFFGYYGNYVGSFYPREHYNSGYVILRQAEHYLDPARRLELARKFVEGALANILQVLRYYQNRGKELTSYVEPITRLAEESLPACGSVEELMAIEGNAREYYYESFNTILEGSPFTISGRSKRPPADPLNALISFGNSIIYAKILTEIYKTHLDPRIGYLHATNFRRFTLNLDVAEIFKPILADRVLFTLVGKKMLGSEDFERRGGAYFLKERGRRLYVQELEEKLQSTFHHRRLRRNVSYQTLLRMELYKVEKHLMGEQLYEPFVSRW